MKWVLIDLSYLAYRAMWALRGLEYNDFPTAVIYGFFEQLRTVCFDRRVMSNKVAVFFDSRQSYRRRQFSEYKRKRQDKTPAELAELKLLHQQTDLLFDSILPDIGFCCYRQTGLESDDLIAMAAKLLSKHDSPLGAGVMVTADGDLYQSITECVHWYDPARDLYLTPEGLWAKKGVFPSQWVQVKAIAGCHSDNVPGVPGVGEKGAIAFVMETLPKHHKRYKAITSDGGQAVVGRNIELVCLPHVLTKPVDLVEPSYSPSVFQTWCRTLGIASYLSGRGDSEWCAFFNGEMDQPVTRQTTRKRGEPRGRDR